MTTQQLFRAEGLLNLAQISQKKIVVIGAGSLGSLFLGNMAYPWQQVVIADPDPLKVENVERHLLSAKCLGMPKVQGIRDWLVERGVPQERILAHSGRVQEILYDHPDADLAVVAVDDDPTISYVGAWARMNGVAMLTGGVHPRGSGGRCIFLPNSAEVCYACAAHSLGLDDYKGKTDQNYGLDITQLLDGAGNLVKVPALRAPIEAIAADMAIMALEYLQGGALASHVLYRALNAWEAVLVLGSKSPELRAVTGYQAMHPQMGFLPHMRLRPIAGGYELQIRNGSVPRRIERWAECPNHDNNSVSLDEI